MKNHNAKIKILAILFSTFYFLTAGSALAATLSLSPANVSVTQGQTFSMSVALNPQGQASYTVKVELSYPAALLEVQSFTFANGWLPLTQSGYDLVDNTNGRLIKTAGYPGGVSGPSTFGTVSFRAKTSGSGNIALTANSLAFDANSQNTLTSLPVSAVLAVSALAATPALTPAPAIPTPAGPAPTAPTPTPASGVGESEEATTLAPEGAGFNLFAAIGNVFTLGTGRAWVAALVALVGLGLIYYLVNYLRRKKR